MRSCPTKLPHTRTYTFPIPCTNENTQKVWGFLMTSVMPIIVVARQQLLNYFLKVIIVFRQQLGVANSVGESHLNELIHGCRRGVGPAGWVHGWTRYSWPFFIAGGLGRSPFLVGRGVSVFCWSPFTLLGYVLWTFLKEERNSVKLMLHTVKMFFENTKIQLNLMC